MIIYTDEEHSSNFFLSIWEQKGFYKMSLSLTKLSKKYAILTQDFEVLPSDASTKC